MEHDARIKRTFSAAAGPIEKGPDSAFHSIHGGRRTGISGERNCLEFDHGFDELNRSDPLKHSSSQDSLKLSKSMAITGHGTGSSAAGDQKGEKFRNGRIQPRIFFRLVPFPFFLVCGVIDMASSLFLLNRYVARQVSCSCTTKMDTRIKPSWRLRQNARPHEPKQVFLRRR